MEVVEDEYDIKRPIVITFSVGLGWKNHVLSLSCLMMFLSVASLPPVKYLSNSVYPY